MVEIYDAHEQSEIVKKWLSENGSAMIMGLVIAFGGLFGFKQWQSWQENNKQQASTEYVVLSELLTAGQLDAAMANFQNLRDNYSSSPYTSMAALQMARARLEASQTDLAVGLYEFVMENGYPKAMSVIARVRLARVLLELGTADKALEVVQAESNIFGFESRFAEVRGDIYQTQGKVREAVAAYLEAFNTLEAGEGDRATLVLKLESLGADIPDVGSES
ncbi:MAG: tetratricopeptide repeat protein [Proteobacteria bacterium]|nr:tetratricopeptide repeat protein [Pseudomonadota bacterium]